MSERVNVGLRLLPATVKKLDATADRMRLTRTAVVELLIVAAADQLHTDATVILPRGKSGSRGRRGMGRRKPQDKASDKGQ